MRSVLGRPLKAEWEGGRLKYTQAVTYPVQSSAADVMLVAMARPVEGLRRHDAHLVLQVHDELVVEVAEAEAPTVEQILVHVMTEAFAELFPMAPLVDLVKATTARVWSDAKLKTAHGEAAITYVRKRNVRGDRHHPHFSQIDEYPVGQAAGDAARSRSTVRTMHGIIEETTPEPVPKPPGRPPS